MQIENNGKDYSRILKSSYIKIGVLFYRTNCSSPDCVDSVRETKLNGLKTFVVFGSEIEKYKVLSKAKLLSLMLT